jgi:predicted AAA+ superfamily ATPase
MIYRALEKTIQKIEPKYRAITLVGPRQSGKTTLARKLFHNFDYLSLENPDHRRRALDDPRGFLNQIKSSAILDEIQKTPDLLSYLQEILDDKNDKRKFILTGSDSLLLSDKVSQSLAGRARILRVFPFFRQELPEHLRAMTLNDTLWTGSYPRIFDERLDPAEWYGDYYQTYVEKDVRSIAAISNLAQFDRFVRICAGRAGQLSDYSAIASEVGISQPTANSWTSILQTSFIVFLLQPHFKNFNKRIIKSPKIYFYDTGLLCYLLRVRNTSDLVSHPLRGAIFENWVISERLKQFAALGVEAPLYFWRDQHGHEIDLVEDQGQFLRLVETKSAETFHQDFLKNMNWLSKLQGKHDCTLVYGGAERFTHQGTEILPWSEF